MKKALQCNTDKNIILAIVGVGQADLNESIIKISQMSAKAISSKVVTLATPLEENGN